MLPQSTCSPNPDTMLCLADGGLETTLAFHEKMELPCFAAFTLLDHEEGRAALRRFYREYADLARDHGATLLLDTPTWRASADWGRKLGYDETRLREVQRQGAALLAKLREDLPADQPPFLIGGSIGPRSGAFRASAIMSPGAAERYHSPQVEAFVGSEVDFVSALTLNYASEAIGIVQAARKAELPVVVSFTVETDGRLPTGQTLGEAIAAVELWTAGYPSFYMVNCAHTVRFRDALTSGEPWTARLGGLRCNAPRVCHAERDEADPVHFATEAARLVERLPHLRVFGGSCGIDSAHVDEIAQALALLGR